MRRREDVKGQEISYFSEPELTSRRKALNEAADLVDGDRNKDYGEPADNFGRIADLWSVVIGSKVTATEVALMLALVKAARLVHQPDHRDSWVDLAGYAGIGAELNGD